MIQCRPPLSVQPSFRIENHFQGSERFNALPELLR
jgi:hypothetical protein